MHDVKNLAFCTISRQEGDVSKVDLRNRVPEVDRLPDSRLRVTRTADVLNFAAFTPEALLASVWLPWGTPDEKYTECRLIKQDVHGQHPAGEGMRGDPGQSPERHPPHLVRVYETIDAQAETAVGNADVKIGPDGLTIIDQDYIQFSTGTAFYGIPGTTLGPSPWTTTVLRDEARTDDGTLRRIKRTFINKGLISQVDQIKNLGTLLVRTLVYVNQVPPTPSGYSVIEQRTENPGGLPVYHYTFVKGSGVYDQRVQHRDGGLRLETWISYGDSYDVATMQPPGVLMVKDVRKIDGTYEFAATCMQNAGGGDPTQGNALFYWSKHPFRYPGRAKAYAKAIPAIFGSNTAGVAHFTTTAYDIFKSPPVDVELDALVAVSYGTASVLSLGTAFWNPTSWATAEAVFQPTGTIAVRSIVESMFGYRAINAGTALVMTAGSTIVSFGPGTVDVSAYVTSCMGTPLYQLSSGKIVVYGGPEEPDNKNWILSARMDEAFVGMDGTRFFRYTQVGALVPAQDALPV